MTSGDLLDLLSQALVKEAGGSRQRWRRALGPVRVYDVATHPHCNWSLAPSGSTSEVATIEAMLDRIRARHPIVVPDRG